jgi:hypothetical protein
VLLIVDDLQWLDQSSAAVLQHLIRRCEEDPVCFLFAARERELRADDELREFVANNRGEHFSDVVVDGLDPRAGADLVRTAGGDDQLSDQVATLVAKRLGFNPFLITATLREGLVEALRDARSTPAAGDPRRHFSAGVIEHFRSKFGRLTDRAKKLATTLAIWGKPVTFQEISTFLTWPEHITIAAMELLISEGVVRLDKNITALKHDLYRDWIYAESSIPLRLCEHRAIADYLANGEQPDGALIAAHYDTAGESERAFHYAMIAASGLISTGAFGEAEHFLRLAIRHAGSEKLRREAEFQLAEHLFLHSSQGECRALYLKLGNLSRPEPRMSVMARARLVQLDLEAAATSIEDIRSAALEVVELAVAVGDVRAAVAALGAATRSLWYGGAFIDCPEELDIAQRLLPLAKEDSIDTAMECKRSAVLAAAIAGKIDLAPAMDLGERSLDNGGVSSSVQAGLHQMRGFVEWMTGDLIAAEGAWSAGLSAAEQAGHLTLIATSRTNLAVAKHYRKPDEDVDETLREALCEAERRGLTADCRVLQANRALFAWENGRFGLASDVVNSELSSARQGILPGNGVILGVAGLLALREGDRRGAHQFLSDALERLLGGKVRSQDPSVVLRLARRLASSDEDLNDCMKMAAQVIESTVHSKVCVWKLDLEIAASARALGDASRALMIATRVRQVASSVGANRVAAVARRIQASFGTSPTAETRALGRKYDQLDTKQRASDLATNPRKLEVGGG